MIVFLKEPFKSMPLISDLAEKLSQDPVRDVYEYFRRVVSDETTMQPKKQEESYHHDHHSSATVFNTDDEEAVRMEVSKEEYGISDASVVDIFISPSPSTEFLLQGSSSSNDEESSSTKIVDALKNSNNSMEEANTNAGTAAVSLESLTSTKISSEEDMVLSGATSLAFDSSSMVDLKDSTLVDSDHHHESDLFADQRDNQAF